MLERTHTFRLRNGPQKDYLLRFLRVGSVPILGLLGVLYLLGVLAFPLLAYFLIIVALALTLPPLMMRLNPGDVTIDPAGLRLHGITDRITVPWPDITAVELEDLNSRIPHWLCSVLGIDGSRKYVHVRLRVPLKRTTLPSFRMTTTGQGTPIVVGRGLVFLPDDPEAFVREANDLRYVAPAGQATD